MHTHSVSLTSGTDKSSYYASLSAMSDPGWTKTSKVERYTANINATYNIFKNLSLNLISNGSYRKQKAPGTLSSATNYVTGEVKREFDINPYSYALNTSRTLDPDEFYTRNYASLQHSARTGQQLHRPFGRRDQIPGRTEVVARRGPRRAPWAR